MDYFNCLERYADATARLLYYCGHLNDVIGKARYYDYDLSQWVLAYLTGITAADVDKNAHKDADKTSLTTATRYFLQGLDQDGNDSLFRLIILTLPDGTILESAFDLNSVDFIANVTALRRRQLQPAALTTVIAVLQECFDRSDIEFLTDRAISQFYLTTTIKCHVTTQTYSCNITPGYITSQFSNLLQQASDLTTNLAKDGSFDWAKVKILLESPAEVKTVAPVESLEITKVQSLIGTQLDSYRALINLTNLTSSKPPTKVKASDITSVQWLLGRSFDQAVTALAEIEPNYQLRVYDAEFDEDDYQPNRLNVDVDGRGIIREIVQNDGRWRF